MTKESRIHSGEKTDSSISNTMETKKLHVTPVIVKRLSEMNAFYKAK